MFTHNFVPKVKLEMKNIDGKRHYILPDGTALKSVTTIIEEKSDKTSLHKWRERVGAVEAQKVSAVATRRGTSIHKIAENYVMNEENYLGDAMPVNIQTFNSIKKELDAHVNNIYGIELPLYSKYLRCAGRTDLVAEFNGVTSIIDFKTAKKPKKEEWIENYFIQSTCYSLMFERMYDIKVPQVAIIIAVDHEETAQTFVMDRSKYVNRVLEVFKG